MSYVTICVGGGKDIDGRGRIPARAADLCCGEGAATLADSPAEMTYALSYTGGGGIHTAAADDPQGPGLLPVYSIIMAPLEAALHLSGETTAQVLLAAREKKPGVIAILAPVPPPGIDGEILHEVSIALQDAGYWVCHRPAMGENFNDLEPQLTVIIATRLSAAYIWWGEDRAGPVRRH